MERKHVRCLAVGLGNSKCLNTLVAVVIVIALSRVSQGRGGRSLDC